MSTTPKHTPGPWYVVLDDREDADGKFLHADVHGPSTSYELACITVGLGAVGSNEELRAELEANAHLIAAAPSLLAACKMVDAAFNAEVDKLDAWDAVRLAIAEAEGEG